VAVRGFRGAVQVEADEPGLVLAATSELVTAVMERNGLSDDDLISMVFTATPDLTCQFPAAAARGLGLVDVPLLCAAEIPVPGAMPRVVRLLAHAETALTRADVRHVYLGATVALRDDLPR